MSPVASSLYWLIIAGVLVGESLLILWAATSTRPRLVRALVVWVTIVMLMAIDAKGPALVFTITAAMTWAIIAGVQRLTGEKQRGWNFQLADLLIAVLLVATVASLVREMGPSQSTLSVLYVPLVGLPLAPAIAFAHLTVTSPARARMVGAWLLSVAISALCMVNWRTDHALRFPSFVFLPGPRRIAAGQHLLWLIALIACVCIAVWAARQLWTRAPGTWRFARVGYSMLLALAIAISVLLVARYSDEIWLTGSADLAREAQLFCGLALPIVLLSAIVAIATSQVRRDWGQMPADQRRLARMSFAFVGVLLLVPMTWLYWQMLWPTPFPPPPASDSNRFNEVLASLRELHSALAKYHGWGQPATLTRSRPLLLPRELFPQFYEVVAMLDAPSAVPTESLEQRSRNPLTTGRPIDERELISMISFLDASEFDGQIRGRPNEAADLALAKIRLLEMLCRGGMASDVGLLLHERNNLEQYRNQVSLVKAEEIVEGIERVLVEREPWETLAARERVHRERHRGWQGRLAHAVHPQAKEIGSSGLLAWYYESELRLRSLQVLYASRPFYKEYDRPPAELAELVPRFLPSVPLDPYSHEPLRFSAERYHYKLYSVGPNGIDNSGEQDDLDLSCLHYQH